MSNAHLTIEKWKKELAWAQCLVRQIMQTLGKKSPLEHKKQFWQSAVHLVITPGQSRHEFLMEYAGNFRAYIEGLHPANVSRLAYLGPSEKHRHFGVSSVQLMVGRTNAAPNITVTSGESAVIQLALFSLASISYDMCLERHYPNGIPY